MRLIGLVSLLLLGGCDSEAGKAANAYEVASRGSAGNSERCEAANKAKELYLREGDDNGYRKWRSVAAMDCLRACAEQGTCR